MLLFFKEVVSKLRDDLFFYLIFVYRQIVSLIRTVLEIIRKETFPKLFSKP